DLDVADTRDSRINPCHRKDLLSSVQRFPGLRPSQASPYLPTPVRTDLTRTYPTQQSTERSSSSGHAALRAPTLGGVGETAGVITATSAMWRATRPGRVVVGAPATSPAANRGSSAEAAGPAATSRGATLTAAVAARGRRDCTVC